MPIYCHHRKLRRRARRRLSTSSTHATFLGGLLSCRPTDTLTGVLFPAFAVLPSRRSHLEEERKCPSSVPRSGVKNACRSTSLADSKIARQPGLAASQASQRIRPHPPPYSYAFWPRATERHFKRRLGSVGRSGLSPGARHASKKEGERVAGTHFARVRNQSALRNKTVGVKPEGRSTFLDAYTRHHLFSLPTPLLP